MKRLRLAPLLALPLAAVCSDSATGPRLTASVQILASAAPLDERTIAVGDTVKLTGSPRDAAGKEIPGRGVRWTSSAPGVAHVDTAGLVRGVGLGTALIVATSDASADTARFNVAAPVGGPVACAPGEAGISLGLGQTYTATAWELNTLCFQGGAAGAEYLLVPFHASRSAGGERLRLKLASAGVVSVAAPSTSAYPLDTRTATGARPGADEDFHLRLRERAMPGLTARMREMPESGGLLPSRSLLAASVPRPGEMLRLNVETRSDDGCANPVYRTGRVVAVTQRAIVVADTANPARGFTDDEYRAIGAAFDDTVYPLDVENFGAPSDLDQNQRILVFFTSAVNDLTQAGSGFYVGGFFYDRDLFPGSGQGACAGSNVAEIVYMMVPDPEREIGEPAFSKQSVKGHTLAVIAHEFQHLINASRRLHVNRAGTWEELWLNEGLSHIAEELLYYRVAGRAPRSNEDGSRLDADPARTALLDYQANNLERYVRFLRAPHTVSLMGEDVLPTRGAIWSFLRYAADRQGGSEQAFWSRLTNTKKSGVANLEQAIGTDVTSWMRDWALSVYLDDAGIPTAEGLQQPSWNFRLLLPRVERQLQGSSLSRFPLRTLQFQGDNEIHLNLPTASAAYVRFGVPAGSRAAVQITSGGLPAPRKLQLTVVRTR